MLKITEIIKSNKILSSEYRNGPSPQSKNHG